MSNYRFHSPTNPWSNVDGRYVNVGNTHNPSNFGSNETSREFGLSGITNNVKAAAASVLNMSGGRRKKNKMSRKYIMKKKGSLVKRGKSIIRRFTKMTKSVGRKIMRLGSTRRNKRRSARRQQRGGSGYLQYGSNAAANAVYETGPFVKGLPAHGLLANPAPFSAVGVNCPNAYRH